MLASYRIRFRFAFNVQFYRPEVKRMLLRLTLRTSDFYDDRRTLPSISATLGPKNNVLNILVRVKINAKIISNFSSPQHHLCLVTCGNCIKLAQFLRVKKKPFRFRQ